MIAENRIPKSWNLVILGNRASQFIPKEFDGVKIRISQVLSCQSGKSIYSQTCLCVGGIVFVKTGKALPQSVATKLEAHFLLFKISLCAVALRFP